MKELRSITFATAASLAVFATQPASANPTQVTNVRLNPNGSGVDLVLETQGNKAPQVFNVNRGNTWNAYVFNAQIRQPFRQDNPAPGISLISVVPVSGNGVQVTVVGKDGVPIGQVASRNARGVIFNVGSAGGGAAPAPTEAAPMKVMSATTVAQSTPSAPLPTSRVPVAPFVPTAQVPNQGQPTVPVAPVPPLLRRAVAPPVGDQAVSQIDTSPSTIDLGSNERIPRLVLRDAPVREVLSLLARAAGLNLAYTDPSSGQQPGQQPGAKSSGPTISLDIENESVQDVFNYVLRVTCVTASSANSASSGSGQCSSLEANRVGRTLFVGPRLPDEARNTISRTIRLNQVPAADAAAFLTTQGAETQRPFNELQVQTIGAAGTNIARVVEVTRPTILALRATEGTGPLILRGLAVTSDDRLNSITISGTPKKVEIATRLLTQLDARKRQVALNVKIVDVNLLRTDDFNTSFSFGIGNNFFTVDKGAALFNFGQYRPPTLAESQGSLTSRPVTGNLLPSGTQTLQPFLDSPNNGNTPYPLNTTNVDPFGNITGARAPFGTESSPFQPGVSKITPPQGTTPGSVEFKLPSLFQFPTKFLASLQSQVTSGNAKVLADPTVIIQDGESSAVKLVEEIFTGFKDGNPLIREAGLILNLKVDRIDDNGFVTIRTTPEISAPQAPLRTVQGDITLISRRVVESGAIRVRDGQTLILSGIIQERDRATVRKVPILGDLPILGSLFRSTTRDNQRQEVIVIITPQIIEDGDNASFGYGYTPGKEVRQFLQQQGNR